MYSVNEMYLAYTRHMSRRRRSYDKREKIEIENLISTIYTALDKHETIAHVGEMLIKDQDEYNIAMGKALLTISDVMHKGSNSVLELSNKLLEIPVDKESSFKKMLTEGGFVGTTETPFSYALRNHNWRIDNDLNYKRDNDSVNAGFDLIINKHGDITGVKHCPDEEVFKFMPARKNLNLTPSKIKEMVQNKADLDDIFDIEKSTVMPDTYVTGMLTYLRKFGK